MRNAGLLALLLVASPAVALAGPDATAQSGIQSGTQTGAPMNTPGEGMSSPMNQQGANAGQKKAQLPIPQGAQLLGQTDVTEIRTLPELTSGQHGSQFQRVAGVQAIDSVYATGSTYQNTVAFFDDQLKSGGFNVQARVATPTSTAWLVKRPDGTTAEAIVRNTQPTVSLETIQSKLVQGK